MLSRFPTFSQGRAPRVSLLAALCLLPLITACGSEEDTLPPPDAALDCESIEMRLWPDVGECHPRCQWEVIGYPVDPERNCIRREPVRVACSPREILAMAVTCYEVPGLGDVRTSYIYPSLPFTRSWPSCSSADNCPADGSE